MRLHLVGLPHTQTTTRFLSCAYTQKVVKFCRMMHGNGRRLVLYSGDENEAPCDEHVVLFTEQERAADWGDGFNTVTSPLRWDASEPYWHRMNTRAVSELEQRAEPGDLVLITAGWAQQPIPGALTLTAYRQLLCVEWAVGYEGIFSEFCAFESQAWLHHVYGRQEWSSGRFYDTVIPNFFDPADFHTNGGKSDYLLFVGRMVERKGPHVAAAIAERLGMPLKLAGPGVHSCKPGEVVLSDGRAIVGDVEYVGELDVAARAELMANAQALLAPTLYIEPFGGVTVEAMLSGTPVVTTDFGAFTETVVSEVGRRFRTLAQGIAATEEAMQLNPATIRRHALERYSLDAVRPRFDAWFQQLKGLWGPGWGA